MSDPKGDFAPNAEVYDERYYERMYRPHWFLRNTRKYRERDEALLRLVRPSPGMRLLELGSARGDATFFFAPRVASAVGIDAAPAAVSAARERALHEGIPNVRFELADARALSLFSDASFDAVLLADFVEHVMDDVLAPALAESRRVLVKGGALAVYTPNREHWAERIKATVPFLQQEDHIAVRPAARVVELVAKAGFTLDELFFSASPYPLLGALDRAFPSLSFCRFRTCLRALV
ncbi:MAG TPA: class I SAM-dependent methyltransferase [Thermoanaerobaculia bacterium]|nr:class I SAM-dependent methyltransferase [Thermoanaerobaculia bacterium]